MLTGWLVLSNGVSTIVSLALLHTRAILTSGQEIADSITPLRKTVAVCSVDRRLPRVSLSRELYIILDLTPFDLIDELGIHEEMVQRLPADTPTPPPPWSKTARSQQR
jgi:hypothetical protein